MSEDPEEIPEDPGSHDPEIVKRLKRFLRKLQMKEAIHYTRLTVEMTPDGPLTTKSHGVIENNDEREEFAQ